MSRLARWLFLAALLLRAGASGAATSSSDLPIELSVTDCGEVVEAALREQLRIEFRTLGVGAGAEPERVSLLCRGEAAELTLTRSVGDVTPTRVRVELAGTPEAERPRLLALAISELVEETRSQPPPPTKPPALQAKPAPRAEPIVTPPPVRSRVLRSALFLAPSLRTIPHAGLWLGGAELGAETALVPAVRFELSVQAEFGASQRPLAHTRLRAFNGAIGFSFVLRDAPFELGVGPAFVLGRLSLDASPTLAAARGASASALWGGPLLSLRGRCAFSERTFAQLSLGAGWLTWGLRAVSNLEQDVLLVRGAFANASLGAGLRF